MKFDCGETLDEKRLRLGEWHEWFAWRPVMLADHDCRWLEWVERRIERRMRFVFSCPELSYWKREYRAIQRGGEG